MVLVGFTHLKGVILAYREIGKRNPVEVHNLKPLGNISVDWIVFGRPKTETPNFIILFTEDTKGFSCFI